jgi:SAM-dependent methyltransferase
MDQQVWDDLYSERDQLWSGAPNGLLVDEVADLPPGQALDVGCGEGGDARWLARRGWLVTAVDISRVALERAAAAGDAGNVNWTHGDLTASPPPAAAFDLVSAIYFPVPHQPDHRALHGLLAAVAPGGTLLVGAHDLTGHDHRDHRFNPDDYYTPAEIVPFLGDDWTILTHETRPRTQPHPIHVNDIVLRARRR